MIKSKIFKNSIGIVFAFLFLGWAIGFLVKDDAGLRLFSQLNIRVFGIVCTLQALFLWSNGLFLQSQLRCFNLKLKSRELFFISVLTNAGNTFLPLSSGMFMRAAYLKKRHNFSMASTLGLTAATYIINYLVVFFAGSICSLYLAFLGNRLAGTVAFFLFCGFIGLSTLVFLQKIPRFFPRRMRSVLERALENWRRLILNRKLLLQQIFLSAFNIVLSSLMLWYCVRAFLDSFSLTGAVIYSILNSLGIFLKLTPGNLGVTEALLLFAGQVSSIPAEVTLLAAAVFRITGLGTVLVLLPFALFSLFGSGWVTEIRAAISGSKKEPGDL